MGESKRPKEISQKEARQYKKSLAELSESVLVFLWRWGAWAWFVIIERSEG